MSSDHCDRCGGLGRLGILSNINLDPNATVKCADCKGTGLKRQKRREILQGFMEETEETEDESL